MKSEINVTPIIDVMLVLLIIFMVVTPLTQKGLDVELPQTADRAATKSTTLVLEADVDGNVSLNRQSISTEELPGRLRDLMEARTDKSLFLRAHEKLRYRDVVAILDVARASGVERVGILSD